nr:PadR family transcriptional regulator [Acinetobacter sp. WCHAc060025]
MKLLVLHLIAQQPKHGYEIIKEISDLVGGGYSPSAGTIYPTLSWLEDMGFVQAQMTEGDRKQYHITEAGNTHLQLQNDQVNHLLERLETRREIHENDQLLDIHRAMENLKTALRLKLKNNDFDSEQVRQIAEKIDQAAVEIGRL